MEKPAKVVIEIGSCKGGVGKTTVTVNLAMALRRLGNKVGIFDADLYGPNVPFMLGIRTLEDRLPFKLTMKSGNSLSFIPLYSTENKKNIEPIKKFGLSVMSLGLWFGERTVSRDSSFLGAQLISQVMSDTNWGDLDFLIIDLPPGTGDLVKTMLKIDQIDGVVLVNTPQDLTLLDTGKTIEMIRNMGGNILGRVENMSYLNCPNCKTRIEVYSTGFEEWKVFEDIKLLGSIPLDHVYAKPIDENHPFTQVDLVSDYTNPIIKIAENIINSIE